MTGTFYNRMTLTLAAGETRQVNAYGRYFRVLGNTIATDPMVIIGDQAGEQKVSAGLGLELPIDPTNDNSFARLLIRNPAGSQMVLDIAISSGKIDDSRLSVSGSITIQDGGNSITIDNADITAAAASLVSVDSKATDLKANTRSLNGDTGTQIDKVATVTGTATATIHTVTAGKTFYLTNSNITGVSTTNGYIVVTNAADVEQYTLTYIDATGQASVPKSYINPRKIPAGWKVKLVNVSGARSRAEINGWEE